MREEPLERRAVISGIGQSAVGRRLHRSGLDLTIEAVERAVADAGLTMAEVDGISTYPGTGGPFGGASGADLLAVSGKLNLEMGGPGFNFFDRRGGLSDYTPVDTFDEACWRRMIYAHKIRMQAVDIFGAFDCPDGGQMTPQRTRSITPLQSLSLFNSPFVNRQAEFLAQRLCGEVGDDPTAQIDRAFELALSRAPEQPERDTLVQLAADHGLQQACRVIFNMSEFVFLR